MFARLARNEVRKPVFAMLSFIPNLSLSEFQLGRGILWVWVFLICGSGVGCHTLVHRKSDSQLVAARQLSLRGADALQRSRQQDAEILFSEALRNSPSDERAHWGYATSLWKRGNKERAIEHMREAVRLSGRNQTGRNPEYTIRLGEMSLAMGDRKSAKELALGVLSTNRSHAEAWALLGDTHQSERDWPAALECYHRALLIRGNYPRVQLSVAEIYRYTGRPQRSLATLDRMADLQATANNDPEVQLIRGMALADLERGTEAAEALALAADRMPIDRVDRQIQLVHAQHRIGELVTARMTLGRLLASNTDNPEVKRLQTMLDMSFQHLTEPPTTKLRDRTLMAENGIGLPIDSVPGQLNAVTPMTQRLASPLIKQEAVQLLR